MGLVAKIFTKTQIMHAMDSQATANLWEVLKSKLVGRSITSPFQTFDFFPDGQMPEYVAYELERLYANLFSALPICFSNGTTCPQTYVAYRGSERTTVLLFHQIGSAINVMNEGMCIAGEEILSFAHAAFAKFPSARTIRLRAVDGRVKNPSLPCLQQTVLEDIVLTLPESPEAYQASLKARFRSELKRYLNKIQREHPSFQIQVLENKEIEENQMRELVAIQKTRLAAKGKNPETVERFQEIMQLSRQFGLALFVRINGKICAGTLNYRIGNNYFHEILTHDSHYDNYRLGTICAYLTILECISRSGKECHFLWGDADYKYRLGGVRRELQDIYLYRSRLIMLIDAGFACRLYARKYLNLIKIRLKKFYGVSQSGLSLAWRKVMPCFPQNRN